VRAIAWKARQRLHERYSVLIGHHKKGVAAAVAQELCGFVWAIACQVSAPHKVKMRRQTPVKETKAATPKTSSPIKTSRTAVAAKRVYVLDPKRKFKKQVAIKIGVPVRKPKTKWTQRVDRCPHRSRAGSHCAPLRWPGRHRAVKKQAIESNLSQEWIGEWAGGGAVTGEPSLSLRGSDELTLVPRERKRRDSNRGLVITTALRGCVDSRMSA
jgi:hypothetical protein